MDQGAMSRSTPETAPSLRKVIFNHPKRCIIEAVKWS